MKRGRNGFAPVAGLLRGVGAMARIAAFFTRFVFALSFAAATFLSAARAGDIEFTLFDADADTEIGVIVDNDTIDPGDFSGGTSGNYSIEVYYTPGGAASYKFYIDSVFVRTENIAPYTSFGDAGSDYWGSALPAGAFTVRVEAYSATGGTGTLLANETLDLTVSSAPVPSTKTYAYDALGRLAEVERVSTDEMLQYAYDAAGNRKTVENIVTAPLFNVTNASVGEGGNVVFTVTRSVVLDEAVSVNYATSPGTASASDFTAASNTLNFGVGVPSQQISIVTTSDLIYEGNETFTLTLSNPSAGTAIDNGVATGTINNDEAPPAFSVNNPTASEGGNLSFLVTASRQSAFTHQVNYATANNTATAGEDYVAKSGTLTFVPGDTSESVTVIGINDARYEGASENLYLNLSAATNDATIAVPQGVGTINENDPFTTFVRNSGGTLQPGYAESTPYIPSLDKIVYLTRVSAGGSIIHESDYGHCDQTGFLASGYSWTGYGCELQVDP